MAGVDLGDVVDQVGRHALRGCTRRHAVELHTGFNGFGQHRTFFEEHEIRVVLAEGVLGFELNAGREAGLLVNQDFFDLGQQVVATDQEFNRLDQFVDELTEGVFKPPDKADDAGSLDEHASMIAQ